MTPQSKASSLSDTATELFHIYLKRLFGIAALGLGLNFLGLIILSLTLGGRSFLLRLLFVLVASACWLMLAHKQAIQACLQTLCQRHLADFIPYLASKIAWDKLPQASAQSTNLESLQQVSDTLRQIQLPPFLRTVLASLGGNRVLSIVRQAQSELDLKQGASPENIQKLSTIATAQLNNLGSAPGWQVPRPVIVTNLAVFFVLLIF